MKIWLDDIRNAPEGWIQCKTARQAADFVDSGKVTHISFDHDLGLYLDGYWLANYIELAAMDNRISRITWDVHSANPVGRRNIDLAMKSATRFFNYNNR